MKAKHRANDGAAKRVTIKGKRMVMLEETEFDRLVRKADEFEPPLPEPDADGNYPAAEYLCASLAIDIIRQRRRLGLSQADLARCAGVRLESLNRIEQGGVRAPMIRIIEKIERALCEADAKAGKAGDKNGHRGDFHEE